MHLQHSAQVEYAQETFSASECKNNYIKATVKNKGSGLVHFVAFADGYSEFDTTVDVGFDGKVRLTQTAPLSYNEPGALNVEVVDQDGKALSFDNGLSIELASVDAVILNSAAKPHWGPEATLEMAPGARFSPPFSIKSQNLSGGDIHLTTSLKLGEVILTQENHSFEVAPARWLPVLSAIIGALLYSLFSIENDEKRSKIWEKIGTGIVAGAIAWLFTGFDILGLKLDTHSLRTYTITGFLFAFLGVDVLLSKKFPRTVQAAKE